MTKEKFFVNMERLGLALTYDDVTLRTRHSDVLPSEVSLDSMFSRNVPLKIPIVSAAMDTVTEQEMAIQLGMLGGLGVIHKNMLPQAQAHQVDRVKHHLHGFIEKPITIVPDRTIESVLRLIDDKGYHFRTFPVVDSDGMPVGVLTGNDFDFCDDQSQLVSAVMTAEPFTSQSPIDVQEAYDLMRSQKVKVLPLVGEDGVLVGLYTYKDVRDIVLGNLAMANVDENGQLYAAAAIGVGATDLGRLGMLVEKGLDVVVIDTAHADTDGVIDMMERVKEGFADLDVVVGNISEYEQAQNLILVGADGIKVGQGPGSICTTRVVAGIGMPQITAVYECARAANDAALEYGIPVCADGGIVHSGDIPKAIGAGAYSVMMGSALAGTDEAPGDTVLRHGRRWKRIRGMGSLSAMTEHKGSKDRYLERGVEVSDLVPEGVEGIVAYVGSLADLVHQQVGGLRKGMGYLGASTIDEMREVGDFRRITHSGSRESHPHDIEITHESPNYQTGERR